MAEDRPPVRVHDIGLQLERTALAWRRTALALVAAALISTKAMALRETVVPGMVAATLLLIAAGAAWIGPWRYRRGGELFRHTKTDDSSTVPAEVRSGIGGFCLAASSGSVALVGVGAIVWVLLGGGG
ncbi:DUF202 domain-containing protein [Nocardioides sp. NPDC051685]|uniref:DUF202 domain-containing protein n=1 Tax=Nocardioides sp. NPDC051685 TaxID=3364334 RepID=UPI00378E3861